MKLSMMINYSGDFHADVAKVQDLEKAGLDVVWVPEWCLGRAGSASL